MNESYIKIYSILMSVFVVTLVLTNIIGTKIFINCEEFDLLTIVGKKLFIFTTHK